MKKERKDKNVVFMLVIVKEEMQNVKVCLLVDVYVETQGCSELQVILFILLVGGNV